MYISSFTISSDKSQLDLTIRDASNLIALRFWNNDTYKDFSKVIDLNSKLTGSAIENIVITLTDINESYFDGIYFIEAEDAVETALSYVAELTKYKECIIDKIVKLSACDTCFDNLEINVINSHSLLTSLQYAIDERFLDEMISIINTLDRFCESACKTCGSYGNVETIDTQEDNFNPITIKLDGGSLD